MLCLSRYEGQRVRLTVPMPDGQPRTIWVTLTEIRSGHNGAKAKIGFSCDRDIIIAREEVIVEMEANR